MIAELKEVFTVPMRCSRRQKGFSTIELLTVVTILLIVLAFAIPNVTQAVYNQRLRSSAGRLSGLMQQARLLAGKNNATYTIAYTTLNGTNLAYIDLNNDGTWQNGEPIMELGATVTLAAGSPPAAYTMSGDSGSGSPFTNTNTLGFSARGFPCNYASSTCPTPAPNYFVYYLVDARPTSQGWAAVVVTKSGRSKVVVWDGATWR